MSGILILTTAAAASLALRSTVPLVAYVMAVLALLAWRSRRGEHLALYRHITPSILARNLLVLLVIGTAVFTLLALENPILSFSWYASLVQHTALGPQGGLINLSESNPPGTGVVIGSLLLSPLDYAWLIAPFILLLFFLLPRLAAVEERIFRLGTRNWLDGAFRSVVFGLVHLTMGIPLGAALALSLGGLWFTRQYFLGGALRSTVHHLAYNLIALMAITALLLIPL
ncbi:MAG: hypothetical protein CL878_02925 [Dehalococcoidia bacterium]|nr:hypothetical protein [Dehalococcoidia bacterium]